MRTFQGLHLERQIVFGYTVLDFYLLKTFLLMKSFCMFHKIQLFCYEFSYYQTPYNIINKKSETKTYYLKIILKLCF